MTRHHRRTVHSALIGAVAVTALGVTAAPASAKSSLSFTAGPRSVGLGGAVHTKVRASDDNSSFNKVCVQQRWSTTAPWRNAACSKPARHTGGALNTTVRANHHGHLSLRAVLLEGRSPQDKHPRTRTTSRPLTITVH
ncbi:hypothetical protein SAZ_40315 [Streptomyces noursei ZPM]|uniref:Uncharacterized protein n=1 Tax=Streptomyces noursei TaxID=1971 RepID=A0A059WK67_STRNR|nr:hypothetical protein [Streptomyces noursei]AKA09202.1 hypothetical protein SAZ_40315 [Streptomyces noursei ZPM]AIA08227.1 hypothetical protein DC74_7809 [Streptomyces noursei]EOS99868.1 hypothetical protein K530_31713 [Streptomyces noursei CCRC 11814]EXU86623.1 hypothetical protein P354_41080 [Streptomyces noursei PD-1]UWS76532.1 hypothetical protein N1H47_37970 [Streptomyces noursei]